MLRGKCDEKIIDTVVQVCAVALALIIALTTGGCATAPSREAGIQRQWPSPPAEPRILWVKEIRNYTDAGIGKSFWRRIMSVVTGETEPNIRRPYGVLADAEGRLLVADTAGSRVHVMDVKEARYTTIGAEGGTLHAPIAVAEDDGGFAYITDSAMGRIYRYDLKEETLAPFADTPLARPTGIAWNGTAGILYVTDTAAHQVVALDREGHERFRIGSHGDQPGQFHYPTDLFVDKTGKLFVTDALNARIQIFSADGRLIRSFGQAGDRIGNFAKPKGIAVDSDGHIYVCDALFDAVQIFDEEGRLLMVFGSRGSGSGDLWMPAGIHIDKNDTIYVADALNGRIQVFQYLKAKGTDRQ